MSNSSKDELCVFCNLADVKGVVELTDNVVRFEPLNPVVKGHMLFVHRQHTKHAGRSPKVSAEVFEQASKYAGEQARPFNLITSGGKDATQSVFHLHIHYVPRSAGDGLMLPWSAPQPEGSKDEPYAQLFCEDCEALWDIDFTNKNEHPSEYAMAIEQKIGDGCPDCGGELRLIK